MLASKQRAFLRSMANGIDPIVHIGKGEIDSNILRQVSDALLAREIVKCRVLETSSLSVEDSAAVVAKEVNAEVFQIIGRTFSIYKKHPKEAKIVLPKSKG